MLASGAVLLTLQNGLIMSAFGAYLVAITADTGWDSRVVVIGFAIAQVGNGALSPITGWGCDRFGTKAVATAGAVAMAFGCALASQARVGGMFIGSVGVIALGISATGITPMTVAVVRAMADRRTLALGLLPTGVALGGLFVPVVVWLLNLTGWRATFLAVASVMLVIGLGAATVLPTGCSRSSGMARTEAKRRAARETPGGHDLRAALCTSAFWLLVAGHGSALVAVGAVNLHLIPLMTHGRGFSLEVASIGMAAMSVAQLVGQVAVGIIGDRFDKRRLAIGCMLVQTGVLVGMATLAGLPWIVATAVVHGLAWGLRGPLMTSLRTDYFGLASFGSIMGWSMGFVSTGMMFGPLLVTTVAASPGGYPAAFGVLALVTGIGALAFLALRPPRPVRLHPTGCCRGAAGPRIEPAS